MMKEEIEQVSLDIIFDPMTAMRSFVDDTKLQELADSIKDVGLIQPVTLRRVGDKYEVVAGHRRVRAARLAGLGVIKAVVHDMTDEETDRVKVHENLFREDVNPVDEARFIHHLIEKYDYAPSQMSELLGKSTTYLMSRHQLLQFPDYLIEAMEKGQIKLTAASWIARIEDDAVRRDYTRFAIIGGITAKRAQAWFTSWDAGQLPRRPKDVPVSEQGERVEPEPLRVPCVICRIDDVLESMEMHYVHSHCVDAIRV